MQHVCVVSEVVFGTEFSISICGVGLTSGGSFASSGMCGTVLVCWVLVLASEWCDVSDVSEVVR